METRTDGRALYRVRRFAKGRGFKRYFTQQEVAYYKKRHPDWRFRQLTEHDVVKPSTSYLGVNPHRYWGKNIVELRESARKTNNPTISYDDILDVQLALKKGI